MTNYGFLERQNRINSTKDIPFSEAEICSGVQKYFTFYETSG